MRDDDFHKFLKSWVRNFFDRDDPPDYDNLERRGEYEDWSKKFLSHYEKKEREKEGGEDNTSAVIEHVISDVFQYMDEVEEESKKSKKQR
jgi:hypothetical protein